MKLPQITTLKMNPAGWRAATAMGMEGCDGNRGRRSEMNLLRTNTATRRDAGRRREGTSDGDERGTNTTRREGTPVGDGRDSGRRRSEEEGGADKYFS